MKRKSKDSIQKGLKPIAHESGAVSEMFHVVKESTESMLRDKTVSSPHLFGEDVVPSVTPQKQEPQSRETDSGKRIKKQRLQSKQPI